jgi:dimethylhistidine N-methyltransferase
MLNQAFHREVLKGLRQRQKSLPCKYFYDTRGSRLFDEICKLPEYYVTRTELKIMRRFAGSMAGTAGPGCLLIELGSGSCGKVRLLLDALQTPAGYIPVDISGPQLFDCSRRLKRDYSGLEILPVHADFTEDFRIPEPSRRPVRKVIYFPGSTLGNFPPDEAVRFLSRLRKACGEGGGILIGIDLKKNAVLLNRAYDDAAGVTAQFNLNLLHRLRSELKSPVCLKNFRHLAFYNESEGRVEMHLQSRVSQTLRLPQDEILLQRGETLCTEYSYKYSPPGFGELAWKAGLSVKQSWEDPDRLFSVCYLEAF